MPPYRVTTERLIIRCFTPSDAPLLKEVIDANLDHLKAWMPWARNEPTTLDAKVELLRSSRGRFDLGQDFAYGIFTPDETRVLGGTGLHPRVGPSSFEIGYWLGREHTGQGLITEAAAALTKVAFVCDHAARVEIHCDPVNVRSAGVPRRLGFICEATLRNRAIRADGTPRDTMIWTAFADDFAKLPHAKLPVEAFDAAGRRVVLGP
jgi:RimJ/RimL family protein N-acetyltransferase